MICSRLPNRPDFVRRGHRGPAGGPCGVRTDRDPAGAGRPGPSGHSAAGDLHLFGGGVRSFRTDRGLRLGQNRTSCTCWKRRSTTSSWPAMDLRPPSRSMRRRRAPSPVWWRRRATESSTTWGLTRRFPRLRREPNARSSCWATTGSRCSSPEATYRVDAATVGLCRFGLPDLEATRTCRSRTASPPSCCRDSLSGC